MEDKIHTKFFIFDYEEIKSPKDSPAMPGAPMSEEELKNIVKIAEKGPFYNMQQVSRQIDEWKTKYSK